MTAISQLLQLFQVDKQLRGLRSRLDTAEGFLSQQEHALEDMARRRGGLEAQLKQLKAVVANAEGEVARLDARVVTLRDQMNSAKTAKEYNAFLSELNNYKDEKGKHEEIALESMTKVDEISIQVKTIVTQQSERTSIAEKARGDRDAKMAEIKDRLAELAEQRETLAKEVPTAVRADFEALIKLRGDDAMAPVEVLDRRNHEFSCSACMMTVPVEAVSSMLNKRITKCPTCHCILYTEEELLEAPKPPSKSRKSGAKNSAQAQASSPS